MSVELNPGRVLHSKVDSTQVIVVRAPAMATTLTCGGEPMQETASVVDGRHGDDGMELGRRYWEPGSGLEVLCAKPGWLPVMANGERLEVVPPRSLPASD